MEPVALKNAHFQVRNEALLRLEMPIKTQIWVSLSENWLCTMTANTCFYLSVQRYLYANRPRQPAQQYGTGRADKVSESGMWRNFAGEPCGYVDEGFGLRKVFRCGSERLCAKMGCFCQSGKLAFECFRRGDYRRFGLTLALFSSPLHSIFTPDSVAGSRINVRTSATKSWWR